MIENVFYTRITLGNDYIYHMGDDAVDRIVMIETVDRLVRSSKVRQLIKINKSKNITNMDMTEYTSKIVVMDVDEYKRLKEIEKIYELEKGKNDV